MQAEVKQFCKAHFDEVKPYLHANDSTEDIHPKAKRECAGLLLSGDKMCANETDRAVRFEDSTLAERIEKARAEFNEVAAANSEAVQTLMDKIESGEEINATVEPAEPVSEPSAPPVVTDEEGVGGSESLQPSV